MFTKIVIITAGACALGASQLGLAGARIDLSELLAINGGDGSNGTVLGGIGELDGTGAVVRGIGDVSGDGLDDFAIIAPEADPGGRTDAGRTYIVYGTTEGFPAEVALTSLEPANGGDGSAGLVINGDREMGLVALVISGLGDVNGDGFNDVILASSEVNALGERDAGEAYVLFGPTTALGAEFELTSLFAENGGDGTAGFVLSGYSPLARLGSNVAGGGDFNGDGIDDIVISATGLIGSDINGGKVFVVFGQSDGSFAAQFDLESLLSRTGGDGSRGTVLNGTANGEAPDTGIALEAADWNGDGLMDLLIGAPGQRIGNAFNIGRAYLYYGRETSPAEFVLATLVPEAGGDGSDGLVFNGTAPGDEIANVVGAADFNDDGHLDYLIGGRRAGDGKVYVVFGGQPFPAGPALNLGDIDIGDGSLGLVLEGEAQNSLPFAPIGVIDVNGDDADDLVIGATLVPNDDGVSTGFAYVVFGGDMVAGPTFSLAGLRESNGGDGSQGLIINGIAEGDVAGASTANAGDVNGDGQDDLIVGASRGGQNGMSPGEAYVLFDFATDEDVEVGTSVAGIDLQVAICVNFTAPAPPTRLVFPGSDLQAQVACETGGLIASTADQVLIALVGNGGGADVSGTAAALADGTVDCRNRTTGDRVVTATAPDGTWDCAGAGLVVQAGDGVLVLLRGAVE